MDRILIRGIKVFAHHGVTPEERQKGQQFLIDMDIETDAGGATESDDLSRTVDYSKAAELAAKLATDEKYDLIETLAAKIAERIVDMNGVGSATVTVKKPDAPMPVDVDWVGASVSRKRSDKR